MKVVLSETERLARRRAVLWSSLSFIIAMAVLYASWEGGKEEGYKAGYEQGVEDGHMELLDQNSELAEQKTSAERKHHSCIRTLESIDARLAEIGRQGLTVEEVDEVLRVHANR